MLVILKSASKNLLPFGHSVVGCGQDACFGVTDSSSGKLMKQKQHTDIQLLMIMFIINITQKSVSTYSIYQHVGKSIYILLIQTLFSK